MCLKHSQGMGEEVPPFTSLLFKKSSSRNALVGSVNTVLGPLDVNALGVTLTSESLMNVLPGAQYAFDIKIDRAEVFAVLEQKLIEFKLAGGSTIVDASGMFQGRDLLLYEALSRSTGINIIASTGQGPEAMLGGYFLTPQTNPPTPWPAQKFAELFGQEIDEGMVVPRFERRANAGLVVTAVTLTGMTPTDGSLVKGAARASANYGVPCLIRYGSHALDELTLALEETLRPERIIISGLDRQVAQLDNFAYQVATMGAYVGIDHVGSQNDPYITDNERVALIQSLINEGFANQILLSSSATGVSFGEPGNDIPFSYVLSNFVPLMLEAGISEALVEQILVTNPAQVLSIIGEE